MDHHTSSNITYDEFSNSTLYDYKVDVNGYSIVWNIFVLVATGFLFVLPLVSFIHTVRRHNRTSAVEDKEISYMTSRERKIFFEIILISRKFSRNSSTEVKSLRPSHAKHDPILIDVQNNNEENMPVLGDINNDDKSLLVPRNVDNDEENALFPRDMLHNMKKDTNLLVGENKIEEQNVISANEDNSNCSQIDYNESDNARKVDRRVSNENQLKQEAEDITDSTDNDQVCAICLSELREGEEIMQTKHVEICNHAFHKYCLSEWLENHNDCPMCRHEMVTEDEVKELWKKMLVFAESTYNRNADGLYITVS